MKKIIKIGAPIALLAVPMVVATSCGIKLHQKTNKNNMQNSGNWNKPTQPGGGTGTNTGGNGNWNKPTQPGGGSGNGNKPTQPGGGSGTNTSGGKGNWNKPTQPGGGTGTDTGGNGNWNKPTGGRNNWNKPTQPGGGNGTDTGGGNGNNTGGGNNWNKPTQPGGGNGNKPSIINSQGISAPTEQDLKISITGRDGEARIFSELDPNNYEVTYNKENNIWNNDDIKITVKPKYGNTFNNGSKFVKFIQKAKINRMNMVIDSNYMAYDTNYYQGEATSGNYEPTGLLLGKNKTIWVNPGNNKNIRIHAIATTKIPAGVINQGEALNSNDIFRKTFFLKPNTWNKLSQPRVSNFKSIPLYIQNNPIGLGEKSTKANVQFKTEKFDFIPSLNVGKTSKENFEKQLKNNPDSSYIEFTSDHFVQTLGKHLSSDVLKNFSNIEENYKFYEKAYEFSEHLWGIDSNLQGASKRLKRKFHIVTKHYMKGLLGRNIGDQILIAEPSMNGSYSAWTGVISKIEHRIYSPTELRNMSAYKLKQYVKKLDLFHVFTHEVNHSLVNRFFNFNMDDQKSVWDETLPDIAGEILLKKIVGSYAFQRQWALQSSSMHAKVPRKSVYKNFINNPNQNKKFEDTFPKLYADKTVMLLQLYEAFGEEIFANISHELRMIRNDSVEIKSDMKQLNLFVWSKASGYNLLPFYKKWGLHPSSETKRKINALNLQPLQNNIWDYFINTDNTPMIKKVKPINELDASKVTAKGDLTIDKNQELTEELIRSKINLPSNFHYKILINDKFISTNDISLLLRTILFGNMTMHTLSPTKAQKLSPTFFSSNQLFYIKDLFHQAEYANNQKIKILKKKLISKMGLETFKNGNIWFEDWIFDDKNGEIIWHGKTIIDSFSTFRRGTINGLKSIDPNPIKNPIIETKAVADAIIVISDDNPNTADVKKVFHFIKK